MPAVAEQEERPWVIGSTAAQLLDVDRSTIYRWIRLGQLRATKVGGLWWISRADIDALMSGGAE